jgi:hypothetical protein
MMISTRLFLKSIVVMVLSSGMIVAMEPAENGDVRQRRSCDLEKGLVCQRMPKKCIMIYSRENAGDIEQALPHIYVRRETLCGCEPAICCMYSCVIASAAGLVWLKHILEPVLEPVDL